MEEERISMDGIFPCPFCLKICHKSGDLINHLQQHYEKAQMKTEPISEIVSSNYVKNENFTEGKVLKQYSCSLCGLNCPTNFKLRRQMSRVHDESRQFKCGQCSYFCTTKLHLERHETQTHGEGFINGKYPCKICGLTFERKHLKRHLKSAHREQSVAHNASTETELKPESVFNSRKLNKLNPDAKSEIVNQKRSYNPKTNPWLNKIRSSFEKQGKYYKCPKCPYKDESLSSLVKQHLKKIHDESRPYKCSKCSYFYNDIGHLRMHETRVHSITANTRPVNNEDVSPGMESTPNSSLAPEETSKRLETPDIKIKSREESEGSTNLELDTLVNSLDRQGNYYKCPKCPYKSDRPLKLINGHLKIVHDESRPFKCSRCDSFFNNVGHLHLHENRFHGRKVGRTLDPCPVCAKAFKKSYLANHIKAHEKEVPVIANQ